METTWQKRSGNWLARETNGFTVQVIPGISDGKAITCEIWFADKTGINTTSLRLLPIAAIEMELNIPEVRELFESGAVGDIVKLERTSSNGAPVLSGLVVPERPPYGDSFYRSVSDAYRACARASAPPAPAIAKATGANIGQVHGWIREARRRGFLPRGRRGKIG